MIGLLKSQQRLLDEIRLVPSRVQLDLHVARAFGESDDGTVLQAPAIFTLSQWVGDISSRIDLLQGRATPSAPDTFQINRLWHEAIGSLESGIDPQEQFALAALGRNAERLLHQWSPATGPAAERIVQRKFAAWQACVAARMGGSNWCSPEAWISRFAGQLRGQRARRGILPSKITLTGFAELTRLESDLFEALESAGVEVEVQPPARVPHTELCRHGFTSIDLELSAAARWAGREIQRGSRQIAVIVNGLPALAGRVQRIFEDHLAADGLFSLREDREAAFRISQSEPLATRPLIEDALLLLRLSLAGSRARHDFPLLSRLLLSRNWSGGHGEANARASLECEMRASGYYRWSLEQVAQLAAATANPGALRSLVSTLEGLSASVAPAHPSQQFLQWLVLWGWPGDEPCGSRLREEQTQFLGLLERLSSQAFSDAGQCLEQLARMCGQTQAPAPGGAFSPLQVLTPEEAFGLTFDSAWVANLTAENWPPRPIGNPLLDTGFLKNVPRAEHNGMLDYAERLTGALKGCAGRVRFSWCDRIDDLKVSPSPLIADLPDVDAGDTATCTLREKLAPESGAIRGYRDHPWLKVAGESPGKPLEEHAGQRLRSAVKVLNYQSACPLAGYLVSRLDAVPLDMPGPFADPATRGNLVHMALERLYRPHLGTDRQPERDDVRGAVDGTLQDSKAEKWLLPAEQGALEASMTDLLLAWLEYAGEWRCGATEKLEWREDFTFDGFRFAVRIDRANRLDDRRLLLVDYKTGRSGSLNCWSEERPGDLQLPLYAVLVAEKEGRAPGGVAAAHVRLGEMKLHGLSGDESCVFQGISGFAKPKLAARAFANWEAAIGFWRAAFNGLLAEIRQGDCRLQMFREDALKYADLEVLLRREESERWEEAERWRRERDA